MRPPWGENQAPYAGLIQSRWSCLLLLEEAATRGASSRRPLSQRGKLVMLFLPWDYRKITQETLWLCAAQLWNYKRQQCMSMPTLLSSWSGGSENTWSLLTCQHVPLLSGDGSRAEVVECRRTGECCSSVCIHHGHMEVVYSFHIYSFIYLYLVFLFYLPLGHFLLCFLNYELLYKVNFPSAGFIHIKSNVLIFLTLVPYQPLKSCSLILNFYPWNAVFWLNEIIV